MLKTGLAIGKLQACAVGHGTGSAGSRRQEGDGANTLPPRRSSYDDSAGGCRRWFVVRTFIVRYTDNGSAFRLKFS